MIYQIDFTNDAREDLVSLKKSEISAYQKVQKLLIELGDHPYTGTGKPKPLKYGQKGRWSRRITEKHRLVYSVDDEKITVLILSSSGHYEDR
ncbi:MAG: Txe/YoeB family addiction module toxin [Candidatus Symbiothrix sp.]|jgi:toxin YoeB|nr:Txe/YoeB family addiction module toxin [Candidatus Symbiothrix sp.]